MSCLTVRIYILLSDKHLIRNIWSEHLPRSPMCKPSQEPEWYPTVGIYQLVPTRFVLSRSKALSPSPDAFALRAQKDSLDGDSSSLAEFVWARAQQLTMYFRIRT
jgi:hypothetical protein